MPRPLHLRWLLLIVAACAPRTAAAGPPSPDWLTGPRLEAQLAAPLGAHWSGVPLRRALRGLARAQRVPIWIDRRVDPDRKLELALSDVTLREGLERLAKELDLGVTVLTGVVCFAPADAAADLRTLAAMRRGELARLPPDARGRLTATAAWRWDDLAEPRGLLAGLAREAGLTVTNPQQLPHDLWAAADLPPLPIGDRLTLLLAGFDLTYRVSPDGERLELLPIEGPQRIERRYTLRGRTTLEELARLVPEAELRAEPGGVLARGRVEDHERIATALSGRRDPPQPPRPGGKQVYTLAMERAPVVPLLERLAPQLKIELRVDRAALEAAGLSAETPVTFRVEQVELDGLLRAVLEPAGLDFRREGERVEVVPAGK